MAVRYLFISGIPSEIGSLNTRIRDFFKEDYVVGEGYDENSLVTEERINYDKRGYTNLFIGKDYSIYSYLRTRTELVGTTRRGLFSRLVIKVSSENPKKLVDLCLKIQDFNNSFEIRD